MSKAVSSQPAKAGNRWLNIISRILVALLLLLAVLGFLISVAGIAGVWVARSYARSAVIDVTNVTTKTLTTVNNGLGRVNTQVQDARQKVTQMNGAATLLGDRISSSPLVDKFSQLVSTTLAPSIEKVSTAATGVHDTFVAANSKLELLNGLPNVQIPALPQLTTVSDRAQQAQTAVQDLQTSLAHVKSGLVTTVGTAVTKPMARIDAALAGISGYSQHVPGNGGEYAEACHCNQQFYPCADRCRHGVSHTAFHHLCLRAGAAYVVLLGVYSHRTFSIPARFIRLE